MLTPQEISTHVFSKARMGGYNMAMVDEFLDTLTEDYTTLYKENAALKAKLKVLADKVEEYRATEDSMRATLLMAQKMANKMVEEAESEKAAKMIEVEADASARKAALAAEIADEEERLRRAKEETVAFLANMRRLCNSELEFLDGVPEIRFDTAPAEAEERVEEQVQSIEDSVRSAYEEAAEETAEAVEEAAEEAVADASDAIAELKAAAEEVKAEEPEDLEATRRIDFGDLKFGRNYKP